MFFLNNSLNDNYLSVCPFGRWCLQFMFFFSFSLSSPKDPLSGSCLLMFSLVPTSTMIIPTRYLVWNYDCFVWIMIVFLWIMILGILKPYLSSSASFPVPTCLLMSFPPNTLMILPVNAAAKASGPTPNTKCPKQKNIQKRTDIDSLTWVISPVL